MRLLFCALAAHGHVLPLATFAAAALGQGHAVGLATSAGLAEMIEEELPEGVEHLPVGPMPLDLVTEAARRVGEVMAPSAEGIGEIFGGLCGRRRRRARSHRSAAVNRTAKPCAPPRLRFTSVYTDLGADALDGHKPEYRRPTP